MAQAANPPASQPAILAFDTAGAGCAVAVARGRRLLAVRHAAMLNGQAEALLPMVDEAMGAAGLAATALDLVVVTTGPGSFTGIRVGLAGAHGIAFALDLPLIGIDCFETAVGGLREVDAPGRSILVALESRRDDLYIQFFDGARRPLCEPMAVLPGGLPATVASIIGGAPLAIVGDAAARAVAALGSCGRAVTLENGKPVVGGLVEAGLQRWRSGGIGVPARPLYLRPPDVVVAGGRQPPRTR